MLAFLLGDKVEEVEQTTALPEELVIFSVSLVVDIYGDRSLLTAPVGMGDNTTLDVIVSAALLPKDDEEFQKNEEESGKSNALFTPR